MEMDDARCHLAFFFLVYRKKYAVYDVPTKVRAKRNTIVYFNEVTHLDLASRLQQKINNFILYCACL